MICTSALSSHIALLMLFEACALGVMLSVNGFEKVCRVAALQDAPVLSAWLPLSQQPLLLPILQVSNLFPYFGSPTCSANTSFRIQYLRNDQYVCLSKLLHVAMPQSLSLGYLQQCRMPAALLHITLALHMISI